MTFATGGASGLQAFSIFIELAALAAANKNKLKKSVVLNFLNKDTIHLHKMFGLFENLRP